MKTIVFLSCCKSKLDHPAPARELYTGALFRKALAYAEKVLKADAVRIFSAKYGMVHPDQVIEPYALVMFNQGTIREEGIGMTQAQRAEWYRITIPKAVELTAGASRIVYLCNKHYRKGMPVGEVPMDGKVFGQCLQWLTSQLKENGICEKQ